MSFNCPDCDAPLESSVRDLQLEEGEVAQITEGGAVVATRVICSNGCSDKPKPTKKKKKKGAPSAGNEEEAGDVCARSELCSKKPGHMGRCDTKLATRE